MAGDKKTVQFPVDLRLCLQFRKKKWLAKALTYTHPGCAA